nr:hypothetical protein [Tanacetum cinerariifolium]
MGLWYPKDTGFELTAFLDSDHAGCLDSRKSTSGGIQFLGGDKLVSWSSKKQDYTLMSSAKAEYHFIKEKVENGIVELFFVRTEYQLADLFTKALPEERFKYLVRRLEHSSDMKVHSEDGNPARANVKQALGRYSIYTVKRYIIGVAASFQLSRIHKPYAHTQAFKVNQRFINWGD